MTDTDMHKIKSMITEWIEHDNKEKFCELIDKLKIVYDEDVVLTIGNAVTSLIESDVVKRVLRPERTIGVINGFDWECTVYKDRLIIKYRKFTIDVGISASVLKIPLNASEAFSIDGEIIKSEKLFTQLRRAYNNCVLRLYALVQVKESEACCIHQFITLDYPRCYICTEDIEICKQYVADKGIKHDDGIEGEQKLVGEGLIYDRRGVKCKVDAQRKISVSKNIDSITEDELDEILHQVFGVNRCDWSE